MSETLVIVGASARAAAGSALRAGLSPWCADLFADVDLRHMCPASAVRDYPQSFLEVIRQAPSGPWMYTGALENHPLLVEQLARKRTLWGNGRSVLEAVRSPRALSDCLTHAKLPCPAVRLPGERAPVDERRWLVKPLHSAGGQRISVWSGELATIPQRCYLQEFIDGTACAAIFVATSTEVELLGVTRQMVGWSIVHARPFSYSGSIGPLQLSTAVRDTLASIAKTLTACFGLRGVFGIDFISNADTPWLIEVNPRYTASVEVLELALGRSALARHRAAFTGAENASDRSHMGRVVGKAILFADRQFTFPQTGPWQATLAKPFEPWSVSDYADIPDAGAAIEKGQPVLSVFATGPTEEACQIELEGKIERTEQYLFAPVAS